MSTDRTLSSGAPADGHQVRVALDAVYNWNYGSELEELRTLYTKALDLQWIAMRDLPWQGGIDQAAFARSFTMGGVPVYKTSFWQTLSEQTRWEVSRRGSAFMLSNFLHGEQGALMVASQLVSAVPHTDGKFYAATQTLDEARHVEVFARYIELLDHVQPIAESLRILLDATLGKESWMHKCVGMQIVVEGLALYTFRDMRATTEEPLLKQLLTYVARDEARHTAYGIKYLGAVVPGLAPAEAAELEDFAFEATRLLLDSRRGVTLNDAFLRVWSDAGVSPADLGEGIKRDREVLRGAIEGRGGRLGPMSGFVIPTLRRVGLLSDRIHGHFREMFDANRIRLPGDREGDPGKNPMDALVELPEDLDAWVLEGA